MSYNVAITLPEIPAADDEAWAQLDSVIEAEGPVPPVFTELLERLTERYPCICDIPDEGGVWSDGPLRNNLGHRASVLGMVFSQVHEVLPFLVEQANALGLPVFDWQSGTIHRPDGSKGTPRKAASIYRVLVWEYPVPRRCDVQAVLHGLRGYRYQNPRFRDLAEAMAAKYPYLSTQDVEAIWTIGFHPDDRDEAVPLLVESARKLRLCMHDTGSGVMYLPDPFWWAPSFVQPDRLPAGIPRGIDLELAERVIADELRPALEKAGFTHVGYQYVRATDEGWQSVRYGLQQQESGPVQLLVYFGVHIRRLIEAFLATEGESVPTEAWGGWGFALQDLLPLAPGKAPDLSVRSLVELTGMLRKYTPLIVGKAMGLLDRVRTLKGLAAVVDQQAECGGIFTDGFDHTLITLLSDPPRLAEFEAAFERQKQKGGDPARIAAMASIFRYVRGLQTRELQWGRTLQ